MDLIRTFFFSFIFLFNFTLLHAEAPPTPNEQVKIDVDLFLTTTCSHCQKADAFFREVEKKHPWVVVHRYEINEDKAALQIFYEHLQRQNSNNFLVPSIFFCNSHWSGFAEANTTGKRLQQALEDCRQKIINQGKLTPATGSVLQPNK